MSFHELAFVAAPYAAALLAVAGTAYRVRYRKFTVTSLSSQLLERDKLYWGSIPFHWGLLVILLGHLVALLIPRSFTIWNSAPLRLYWLEITGFALGVWAFGGLLILIYRRLSNSRVRAVTTPLSRSSFSTSLHTHLRQSDMRFPSSPTHRRIDELSDDTTD